MTPEKVSSPYLIALYAILSFICIMLIVIFPLYISCFRRYRLNWFEKNLLESSSDLHLTDRQSPLTEDNSKENLKKTPYKFHEEIKRISETENSLFKNSVDGDSTTSSSQSLSIKSTSSNLVPLARSNNHVVLTNNVLERSKVLSMHSKLDHTKIDTTLYQTETPSGQDDSRGSLHIIIFYDQLSSILTVKLLEAQALQAQGFSGTADPYAKIRLLPDKTNVWQTKIHKKTLNPVFDEDFVYEIKANEIDKYILEFTLYDFDAYSRHHSIGNVQLSLKELNLNEKIDKWIDLKSCSGTENAIELGDLMVSLSYLSSAERLIIVVMKARNLKIFDETRSSSDPYVKVSLIQGEKKIKKRRTSVQRNTICPVFNEALTFDIDKETLKNCSIEFSVMHDNLIGSSEVLGKCRVSKGSDSNLMENNFFNEMLNSKNSATQWLTLRDR